MRNEKPMSYLGRGLHQDFAVGANSVDDLAVNAIQFLSASERYELMAFLAEALENCSSSELKGMLNRASSAVRMNSAGARAFLDAVFAQLLNVSNDRR
jgi:hypothetical protein